jgi:phenylacetate-CoA ligase
MKFSPLTLQRQEKSIVQQFYASDVQPLVRQYQSSSPHNIELTAQRQALSLFAQAARRVPAYKEFLHKEGIEPHKIHSFADFTHVPPVNKYNYLRSYSLSELCWDGKIAPASIISSSSGSTGKPFLWPRGEAQEFEGALYHEIIFRQFFSIDKHNTLFINCFAMGTWVAGTFVLSSIERLTAKGYPIISIAPGIDREVALSLFTQLAPQFDQIIIAGYPPFIKDLLDAGAKQGIPWRKHRIKLLFAAEGFSEQWRKHVHKIIGASDDLTTSINCYGSADATLLAHETPLTIAIRQFSLNKPSLRRDIFTDDRLPTLAQYDPRLKYFEAIDGQLLFTSRSGLPLIRYQIGDDGGVHTYEKMDDILDHHGYSMEKLLTSQNRTEFLWKLPFVHVFGRADLTVSLYGLLIYPEHIKHGLERPSIVNQVTGKFVMSIDYDDQQDPHLVIRVELAHAMPSDEVPLKEKITTSLVTGLKRINSEYRRLSESIGMKAIPEVVLIEQGNQQYFRQGIKQKWVTKEV